MSPLLMLGLLVAGFCPAVLGHPGGTLGSETLVQEDGNNVTRVDRVGLASRNTDFAFRLYKQLALKNPKKNIIFSPFSVSVSLAFLSLGAHNTTQKEILESLKFNITESSEAEIHRSFEHLLHTISQHGDELQLSTGSAMFVQEQLQLLAKFKEDAQALYKAQAFTTDFLQPAKAQKLINDYVRRQTQGKIDELISGLDPTTAMVLVNYIFFKSKWKKPFDPRDTFESKFYLSKSRSVKVPMMKIEDLTVPYFWDEELSCSLVELEYLGNASALFILPDQGQMQKLETSLSLETLRRWKDSMKLSMIDELYLPKFSISSDYNLEHVLPPLGIREVFSKQADLSRITGARNLRVSQVVHKAVLDVTEVGTEAAAATGIKMVPLSGKWDPMILSYNRPFILIVTEGDTESILFLGRVVNPKQA